MKYNYYNKNEYIVNFFITTNNIYSLLIIKHNIYIIYIALELSYYKLNIIKTFKPNIYSLGIMLLRIITNIVEKQIVYY